MTNSFNDSEEHLTYNKRGSKNVKLVYVIHQDGTSLMPCKPAKARKLLRDGKAELARRRPFTIRLLWDSEKNVQPVKIGIDKGAKVTGVSAVGNGKVLFSAEVNHRKSVKEKMDARRENRRSRRNRKWYRQARFNNRASSKRSGRIPPSVRANIEEVIRVILKIPLPISGIAVEDVQIDIRKLDNPEISGVEYQKSNRLNPNLRLACLIRDGFKCRICKKRSVKLEAHHIIPRSKNGKDTIKNLVTLCESCHNDLHAGKVSLKVTGENGFKDRMAQVTMQGKAEMYRQLSEIAPTEKVFGYETHEYRLALGLEKSHDADALAVATLRTGEVAEYDRDNFFIANFISRQNRQVFYRQPQKGKGRVRYQVNDELAGFRKGDVVLVKDRWEKRIWSIYSTGYLAFPRVKGEPMTAKPKICILLEKSKTIIWQQ